MTSPAILFAANPRKTLVEDLGIVEKHVEYLKDKDHDSLLWGLKRQNSATSPLPYHFHNIKKGYIHYVPLPKPKVAYEADIEWIKRTQEMDDDDWNLSPPFRKREIERWGDDNSSIWMKITRITPLKPPRDCKSFKLWSTRGFLGRDWTYNYDIVCEI